MKAKIIIVEDHEPIRNELKILLSKYGYEIMVLDRFDTVVEDCLSKFIFQSSNSTQKGEQPNGKTDS